MDGFAAGISTESSFETVLIRPHGRGDDFSKVTELESGHIDMDGQIRRMRLIKATELGQPNLPSRNDVLDRTTGLRVS